jgi:bacterioferritin
MKGNAKVIKVLNQLLADELTAISQYMVHAEMCDDWMYGALHEAVEKRAMTEMKHAEDLIARILFLEGTPIVSKLNPMQIGADVPAQFKNDHKAEADAIKAYNDGVKVCGDAGDFGTRQLLQSILKDEEDHIDWIEGQLGLIDQVGLKLYLAEQIKGSS